MKYIRTYENIIEDEKSHDKYPKYIIWEFPSKQLLLVSNLSLILIEILRVRGEDFHVKILYYLEYGGEIKKEEDSEPSFILKSIFKVSDDNIIYQSDNLQDCLESLPAILSAKKYNL